MQSPDSYPGRPIVVNQELLPSAARVVTGIGDVVVLDGFAVLYLQLDVTAAATDAGDTLDIFLQTTIDGTNWVDIYHFTQAIGTGGAKRYFGKVMFDAALTEFENATALGVAAGRSIAGSQYRVRWEIVEVDAAGFTFSVTANGT